MRVNIEAQAKKSVILIKKRVVVVGLRTVAVT